MSRIAFLDSSHFVEPDRGRRVLLVLLAGLAAACLGGCATPPAHGPVEDSVTSGRIKVVSAPEAAAMMLRQRDAFMALYPDARIEVVSGSSTAAVDSLFGARADVAVLSRELAPEERAAAQRGGLELEGLRFARDGVVVLVHPDNPVQNVALDDLRAIYRGTLRSWSELGGGDRPVVPVMQELETDVAVYFAEEVMDGMPMEARARYAASDSAVVAAVSADPRAIGFASLAWAGRGARTLRVAPLKGLPYVAPDAETVYRGEYPLTRFFSLYVRTSGPPLANGFLTFVTSGDGQRLVHEAGLVPTTVPVRFARRSPMLGTH